MNRSSLVVLVTGVALAAGAAVVLILSLARQERETAPSSEKTTRRAKRKPATPQPRKEPAPRREKPEPPRPEILSVRPGHTRIALGTKLEVVVETRGAGGARPVLICHYKGLARPVRRPMVRRSRGVFACRIEEVEAPLEYYVRVGDVDSSRYRVDAVVHPGLVRRDAVYRYPVYTGLAPRTERLDGENADIKAPVDTQVTLKLTALKPIQKGAVHLRPERVVPLAIDPKDPRQASASFVVDENTVYSIVLVDQDGETTRDEWEHGVTALPDAPPEIKVLSPGRDVAVGLGERIRLVVEARDGYGLSRVCLFARRADGAAPKAVDLWRGGRRRREARLELAWDLATQFRALKVGDEVLYYVAAWDDHADAGGGRKGSGPQQAKTPTYSVRLIDRAKAAKASREQIKALAVELRKVLEDQVAARQRVGELAKETSLDRVKAKAAKLLEIQAGIFTRAAVIAAGIEATDQPAAEVQEAIRLAVYAKLPRAAQLAAGMASLKKLDDLQAACRELAAVQDDVIKGLRQLAKALPKLAGDKPGNGRN